MQIYKLRRDNVGLVQRFWDRVIPEPNSGCWLWTAALDTDGYGAIHRGKSGHTVKAHHVAWELYRGLRPWGVWVLHTCDTPSCVNPDHLYLGTPAQNSADRSRRGRAKGGRGSRHRLAKLHEKDIPEIRRLLREGVLQTEIGRRYNVTNGTISRISTGLIWRHV